MLKVLTKLRNAGAPLQTCHFVVGWFVTICQFFDVFDKVRFQSKKAYFFLKIGRFDTKSFNSSLFDANSSGEILMPKRLQKGGASRSHRLLALVEMNCTWAPTMVHL